MPERLTPEDWLLIRSARGIFQPDCRKVFEPEQLRASVERIVRGSATDE